MEGGGDEMVDFIFRLNGPILIRKAAVYLAASGERVHSKQPA